MCPCLFVPNIIQSTSKAPVTPSALKLILTFTDCVGILTFTDCVGILTFTDCVGMTDCVGILTFTDCVGILTFTDCVGILTLSTDCVGMARMCCDARRAVRQTAITYLQRALLAHELQVLTAEEWVACFQEVHSLTLHTHYTHTPPHIGTHLKSLDETNPMIPISSHTLTLHTPSHRCSSLC